MDCGGRRLRGSGVWSQVSLHSQEACQELEGKGDLACRGDSEVVTAHSIQLIGERTAEEKIIRGTCIILPCPTKPLPIRAAPVPLSKGKSKAIDSEEVLALALAENVDLKEEVAHLREILAQVRHHAWTEQVEMITLSNKAYINMQPWANVEQKMSAPGLE
ncbi:hypothetical protein BDR05DRAFT_1005388 [Suillus weaverae]|nr:hypothetical protein BDR05DRAFT_1005388 [Suillus weaverae]